MLWSIIASNYKQRKNTVHCLKIMPKTVIIHKCYENNDFSEENSFCLKRKKSMLYKIVWTKKNQIVQWPQISSKVSFLYFYFCRYQIVYPCIKLKRDTIKNKWEWEKRSFWLVFYINKYKKNLFRTLWKIFYIKWTVVVEVEGQFSWKCKDRFFFILFGKLW